MDPASGCGPSQPAITPCNRDQGNGGPQLIPDSVLDSSGLALIIIIINPRRACAARATAVVSCVGVSVCMYVRLSAHAILAVRAIKRFTVAFCNESIQKY